MHIVALLLSDVPRSDSLASALQVESLGSHVNRLAVTGQNVRARDRHIQAPDVHLQIVAGLRIAVVKNRLGQLLPC